MRVLRRWEDGAALCTSDVLVVLTHFGVAPASVDRCACTRDNGGSEVRVQYVQAF